MLYNRKKNSGPLSPDTIGLSKGTEILSSFILRLQSEGKGIELSTLKIAKMCGFIMKMR